MSKVDDARSAVNDIESDFSGIEDFVEVYAKIVDAGKTLKENERIALQTVVSNFRGKIPEGATFQNLRDSARRFEEDLAAQIIGNGMANIAARNQELLSILNALDLHIAAANADANKLQQITTNINKATEAVNAIKTLASALDSPNANTNSRIQAVVTALENLKTTFT